MGMHDSGEGWLYESKSVKTETKMRQCIPE